MAESEIWTSKRLGSLTECRFVQKVKLSVKVLQLWIFLSYDADNEMQQRLFSICGLHVQKLQKCNTDISVNIVY